MDESLVFFNLAYILFSFFLIFPPNEAIQLGFSIPSLFSNWLGSEQLCFIHYHIMRVSLTIFIHSLIPIGYYLFMAISFPDLSLFNISELNIFWQAYIGFSILFFIALATIVYYWSMNEFESHPIVVKLRNFSPNSWKVVANDINLEFRRIDKFTSGTLYNRFYLTDNWIIKVNLYSLNICNNSSAELSLTHSTDLNLTQDGSPSIQFLNILVKPNGKLKPFYICLNSLEYKDFTDKLQSPIREAADVVIKQSLPDLFLDAFREIVENNPIYQFKRDEIETCIGCMRKEANVKLVRKCTDSESGDCKRCYCKPMWCLECLGKWFAYRQDQSQPNTWLSSKATCATCRARFCLLDVCSVELID